MGQSYIKSSSIVTLIALGIFFRIGVLNTGYLGVSNRIQESDTCAYTISQLIVSGTSMSPTLSDGQEIQVQTDKNCYTLSRGDIIIYDFAQDVSNANPVVKRVVGVGGDRFQYMSGHIYINDILQKNSRGEAYNISSNMLALYARDYPIIPPDTLLVLGEIPTGSRDSSSFGMISEGEIDGKVIFPTGNR